MCPNKIIMTQLMRSFLVHNHQYEMTITSTSNNNMATRLPLAFLRCGTTSIAIHRNKGEEEEREKKNQKIYGGKNLWKSLSLARLALSLGVFV